MGLKSFGNFPLKPGQMFRRLAAVSRQTQNPKLLLKFVQQK